jgi:hypothetical protein
MFAAAAAGMSDLLVWIMLVDRLIATPATHASSR